MRIAIYHNLPSGGGKRALHEMTVRLAKEHIIDVYTLSVAEHEFCDLKPHCDQHVVFPFRPLPLTRRPFGRLNQGIRSLDLLRLCKVQRQIAAEIDAVGYDVVFVHNCQFGQSPALLAYLQTPSVYYCQEPPRQIYEPAVDRPYSRLTRTQKSGNLIDPFPWIYRKTLATLDRRNVDAAHLVLVNSAYSRESLYRAYGIFAKVCYLGVDAVRFRPITLEKKHFVVSIGQLVPKKGFDFVIRSLARIEPQQRPPLQIISNFSIHAEKAFLEQLARELQVVVSFQTMATDSELVRLYNQALATIYAPIMEPFGFVPIESMACGTPVVGINEAGMRETVLHEVTGLLAERDETMFAEAIRQLLDNPSIAQTYGQQGRAYVERSWSWNRTSERLEQYFQTVVRSAPGI